MDPRLTNAISNPTIRSRVGEVVRLSLAALEDIRRLDDILYDRFVTSRGSLGRDDSAALRSLWTETFRGLGPLLEFCRRQIRGETELPPPDDGNDYDAVTVIDGDGDVGGDRTMDVEVPALGDDLDFGFGDNSIDVAAPAPEANLAIAASEIGDLIESIDEGVGESDVDKWKSIVEKMESIEYGLRNQHDDAFRQMLAALEAGQPGAVLGVFDDAQNSISEGVYALVAAAYEPFVADVDRATLVPGYLTSLGRALLVRRGIAELAATLTPYNNVLLDPKAEGADVALAAVRDQTRRFVSSVVCRAMRAADRWQMVQFARELASAPLAAGRLTSEGLIKYLESLTSVSQREVLILHDQRVVDEIRESVAAARELLELSPRTANELIAKARVAAARLRGRNPVADRIITGIEGAPGTTDARGALAQLADLLEVVG